MVRESDLDLGNAFGRSIRTFAHRLARQGICSFFASADRSRCGRGGCCRFWHSSRLRLPACIDLDRIPWGPVSRAGHASGWPSQARAWHAYGHPDGGLNRERQPSHRRSGALRRNVRPHSGRHPCARRCGAPTTWSTPSAGVPAVARKTGQRCSHICRSARSVYRGRPGRLRHGVPHASTFRGFQICGNWMSVCPITNCRNRLSWWLRGNSILLPS